MATKARCRWCRGSFVRIGENYWCETPSCRARQAEYAVGASGSNGEFHYLYVPLPMGVEFDSAAMRYLLGGGAAGVSKSHTARWALYRRGLMIPGYEALILRNTWDELDKHHLRLMEREVNTKFKPYGIEADFFRTSREFRITFPDGVQSVIEGGHMDDPKDVDKYLSRERDAIVADEGVKFNPQHLLELSTRARSTKPAVEAFARRYMYKHLRPDEPVPGGGAVFWVLSNPGGPAAPMLREMFIDKQPNWENYSKELRERYNPDNWGYIPGNLEDNPYLPESYEDDLAVLSEWRFRQLRYNDWDVVAGQFFPEFSPKTHVMDLGDPGSSVSWFRSMDWGYVSPGVCLWWACLPDGIYYIRYEYKFQLTLVPDVAAEIHRRTRKDHCIPDGAIRYTVIDPSVKMRNPYARSDESMGESIQETFALPPCNLPTLLGDNRRNQGWQRVRELLKMRPDDRPTLVIHPDCRYLIRSLSAAVSDKSDPEDVDTHIDDHALDALRYGAMSRPSPTRVAGTSNPRSFNAHQKRLQEHRRNLGRR